jgi:hypothetical protein
MAPLAAVIQHEAVAADMCMGATSTGNVGRLGVGSNSGG